MWHQTLYELPPEGVTVYTKIDDERGCRNEGKLYRRGNLWFLLRWKYVCLLYANSLEILVIG